MFCGLLRSRRGNPFCLVDSLFVEFDFVDLEREFLNWSADGEELDALDVGAGPGDSLAVGHLLQVSEGDSVLFPFAGWRSEGDVVKHVVSDADGGEIDSVRCCRRPLPRT